MQALNELFGTLGLMGLAEETRVGVGATVFRQVIESSQKLVEN